MSVPYYPGSLYTPNLGLALYSVDSIIAENFVILDTAYGAGSSIFVNGTLVESPNLSSTTPAAPGGQELVTFQYDSNGNISAYVPIPAAGGVTSFTGDSVVYNNSASTGAVTLSLIAQVENTVFAGPTTGANATPTFRALVAADIPALPYGTGTVTSVALATGAGASDVLYTISGSPITTSGNITETLNTQTANTIFAGPSAAGPAGSPTFRSLVTADLPTSGTWVFSGTFSGNSTVTGNDLITGTETHGLTSYTAAVANSPLVVIAGSYQSATSVFAEDSWTIQDILETATTNGWSKLTFTHAGTTGVGGTLGQNISCDFPSGGLSFGSQATVNFNTTSNGASYTFMSQGASGASITVGTSGPTGGQFKVLPQGSGVSLSTNYNGQSSLVPVTNNTSSGCMVAIGNATPAMTTTGGSIVALEIGTGLAPGAVSANRIGSGVQFAPAGGSGSFIGIQIDPVINNTSTVITEAVSAGTINTVSSAVLNVTAGNSYSIGAQVIVSGLSAANNTQLNGKWQVSATAPTTITIFNAAASWTTHSTTSDTGTVVQTPGTYTGLLINPTETAVPSTTSAFNMLLDLQVGGVRTWGVTNKGHVITGAANGDYSGSVSSAPTGIVSTNVVVAVGAATATFTVASTEGFTTGGTVTLSAGGWAGGSGLASSTATVTTITSPTVMILTRASGGPWVAGTYSAQTGTLTQTGGTTVSVTYAVAYTSTPVVVVTPTSNAGAFYISASSNAGFTITYANSGTQTFNYTVVGNPN